MTAAWFKEDAKTIVEKTMNKALANFFKTPRLGAVAGASEQTRTVQAWLNRGLLITVGRLATGVPPPSAPTNFLARIFRLSYLQTVLAPGVTLLGTLVFLHD